MEVLDSSYTVKLGPGVPSYEYRILQFLATIPEVPTPQPIDFFDMLVPVQGKSDPAVEVLETWHVIVMTTVPGRNLGLLLDRLKRTEVVDILKQSMRFINLINAAIDKGAEFPDRNGAWSWIRRPTKSVDNLDGTKGHYIELPFYSGVGDGVVPIELFVSVVSKGITTLPEHVELLDTTLRSVGPSDATDIRFCHMDLHPGNIMVHNGQVSGIIDWELAG